MLTKALIVYGTRYGATEMTAEEIANVFRKEALDVKVVNLKEEKVEDIREYDLVLVGSGIQIGKWTKEPKKFLKKYQKELVKKKVALFVCCGAAKPLDEGGEDKTKEMEEARMNYLTEKAVKYGLLPISLGFFGGVYNFNRVSWLFRNLCLRLNPS